MAYKKVKRKHPETEELEDYLQNKTKKAIYQAPDTPAGKASLDKRRASK